jgi:TetR/AcrR family transcriptional regulator, transcriptional repressor for nem operon
MCETRSEKKDMTRRKILDHGRRMVIEGGPEALTIAPLMSALGLTHGGFYAHFASRGDLLNNVVGEMCSGPYGFEMVADRDAPQRSLERYIDAYLSPPHRDSKESGCPLAYLSGDIPKLSNTAKTHYAAAHQALTRWIADMLRRSGSEDVAALSQSLVAELVGALSIARALGNTKQSAAVLVAARNQMKARIQDAVTNKGSSPSMG